MWIVEIYHSLGANDSIHCKEGLGWGWDFNDLDHDMAKSDGEDHRKFQCKRKSWDQNGRVGQLYMWRVCKFGKRLSTKQALTGHRLRSFQKRILAKIRGGEAEHF